VWANLSRVAALIRYRISDYQVLLMPADRREPKPDDCHRSTGRKSELTGLNFSNREPAPGREIVTRLQRGASTEGGAIDTSQARHDLERVDRAEAR
jgi:hypothetical protein